MIKALDEPDGPMAKKRAARTQRRAEEHAKKKALRRLIHDRERLFKLGPGGTRERPMEVPAASVIELRARSLPCPLCEGILQIEHHRSVEDLRAIDVRCQSCGSPRTIWMQIVGFGPS
ncbi:MAG: hypothetical protein HYV07_13885 [Deltaproteobacteria bacterium]|nr:hypothetical protein [Deltaproteobacteria bacterium]